MRMISDLGSFVWNGSGSLFFSGMGKEGFFGFGLRMGGYG